MKTCPASSAQQIQSDRLRCSEDVCSPAFRAVLAPEQTLGGIQTTLLKNKFKVKLGGKEQKHSHGSWLPFLPSHPQITHNTKVSFDLPTASLFPSLKIKPHLLIHVLVPVCCSPKRSTLLFVQLPTRCSSKHLLGLHQAACPVRAPRCSAGITPRYRQTQCPQDQSPGAGDVFSCLGMATCTYGALLERRRAALCQEGWLLLTIMKA